MADMKTPNDPAGSPSVASQICNKKDSFHNLIFSLTKDSSPVSLTQQPQQDFLFPEGGWWMEKDL